PRGNTIAFAFRDDLLRAGVAGDHLRHLAIRVSSTRAEAMATLVVARTDDKRLRRAAQQGLATDGDVTSLHVNIHPKHDAFIFGARTQRVRGTERLRDDVCNTAFLVSPTAFFQTNIRAAEILVRLVVEHVPPDARVLDLYAGAGLFAVSLARRG